MFSWESIGIALVIFLHMLKLTRPAVSRHYKAQHTFPATCGRMLDIQSFPLAIGT